MSPNQRNFSNFNHKFELCFQDEKGVVPFFKKKNLAGGRIQRGKDEAYRCII
jgi:hypothetical protein